MDFYQYAFRYEGKEMVDEFRFLFEKLRVRKLKVENTGETITLTFEIGKGEMTSTVKIDYFERMRGEIFLEGKSESFHQLLFKVFENENLTDKSRLEKIMKGPFFSKRGESRFREFLQFQVQLKNIEKIKGGVKVKTIKLRNTEDTPKGQYAIELVLGDGEIQQWTVKQTLLPEYAKIEKNKEEKVDVCDFIDNIQKQTGMLMEYTVLKKRSKIQSNKEMIYLWIEETYEQSKENKFIQAFNK